MQWENNAVPTQEAMAALGRKHLANNMSNNAKTLSSIYSPNSINAELKAENESINPEPNLDQVIKASPSIHHTPGNSQASLHRLDDVSGEKHMTCFISFPLNRINFNSPCSLWNLHRNSTAAVNPHRLCCTQHLCRSFIRIGPSIVPKTRQIKTRISKIKLLQSPIRQALLTKGLNPPPSTKFRLTVSVGNQLH